MLRVRFFASIRERLGRAELAVAFAPECADVAALVAHLDRVALPGSAALLGAPNTLVAVNQVLAERGSALVDGDEIAFYPPVTGG